MFPTFIPFVALISPLHCSLCDSCGCSVGITEGDTECVVDYMQRWPLATPPILICLLGLSSRSAVYFPFS